MFVKRFSETAVLPERQTDGSAGYDLVPDITEPVMIRPGETKMLRTNVGFSIPRGYAGMIYARSGLSTKEGLRPANCVGLIDSDFRDGISVPLHNDSDEVRTIVPGQRVAQIVFQPVFTPRMEEVNELDETERMLGGFGSTGKV